MRWRDGSGWIDDDRINRCADCGDITTDPHYRDVWGKVDHLCGPCFDNFRDKQNNMFTNPKSELACDESWEKNGDKYL